MQSFLALILCLTFTLPILAQGTLLSERLPGQISLENCTRINGPDSQFGPAIYGDQLVFVGLDRKKYNPYTGGNYFGLFQASLTPEGFPQRPKRFSVTLNSKYNEGPVGFAFDDKVVFFTQTQQVGGTQDEAKDGRVNLGIYSAFRDLYDWEGIRRMAVNDPEFNTQHPTMAANDERLFFSSDRPGGYGGLDLYFSDFRDGRWGPAINLGAEINTAGDEAFPFIHPSGRLFFASTGHGGRGGYDLYMIDISGRRWGKLFNLPPPINSSSDDISLVLDSVATRGYLASNRPGGEGDDDIYLLRLDGGLANLQGPNTDNATLTIYDGATSQRVAGAEVWLNELDERGRQPAAYYSFRLLSSTDPSLAPSLQAVPKPLGEWASTNLRSDGEGNVPLELTKGKSYELVVFRAGFAPQQLKFAYGDAGPSRPLAVTLQPEDCYTLSGRIQSNAGAGLRGVTLYFSPRGGGYTSSVTTDVSGYYEACLAAGQDFTIEARKPGYVSTSSTISASQLQQFPHPRLELILNPEGNVGRKEGGVAGSVLSLPGLRFHDGTAAIDPAYRHDLNLAVELLRSRPDIRASILSHVAGRASATALRSLSQRRAEAVRDALVRSGITADRLTPIGYGSDYPLRPCSSCTEDDYEFNTRTELRIE